jgi:hypothetical protein
MRTKRSLAGNRESINLCKSMLTLRNHYSPHQKVSGKRGKRECRKVAQYKLNQIAQVKGKKRHVVGVEKGLKRIECL